MVRVGGGWETLEEFLVRNDPCRGKRNGGLQRRASFGAGGRRRPAASSTVGPHQRSLCSTPSSRSRHSSRNWLIWHHSCTIPYLRYLTFSPVEAALSMIENSRCAGHFCSFCCNFVDFTNAMVKKWPSLHGILILRCSTAKRLWN